LNTYLYIKKYSLIRDHKIEINGREEYAGTGEFQDFIKGAYRTYKFGYSKFFKMDNLSKLGFLAAEFLLKDEALKTRYPGDRVGIILQNGSSSLDTDDKHQESISNRSNYFPSPSVFVYTLPNIVSGEISIRHKITGENTVFIADQFQPEFIYNYVAKLFSDDAIDCCICGWLDYYREKYAAFLMLVEPDIPDENMDGLSENIIFAPVNIENLYLK